MMSKSNFKVRLCCKQSKQDVSRDRINLGKIIAACATPIVFCSIDSPFKKWHFRFCNENWLCQKNVSHWVKPADPIFLTPTLLMGALRATQAEPASNLYYTLQSSMSKTPNRTDFNCQPTYSVTLSFLCLLQVDRICVLLKFCS